MDFFQKHVFDLIIFSVATFGVCKSFHSLFIRSKAEVSLKELINRSGHLKFLKIPDKNEHNSERLIDFEEFADLQCEVKKLLYQLDKTYRGGIMEPLEQRSLKGQLSYLNKIIQLTGSKEELVLKND